jgi:tetratricopeptide (TPR) repeat protein
VLIIAALRYFPGCAAQKPVPTGRAAAVDSYVQGVLAYNQGNRDKAIAELQQATRQHDDLIMAHALLGDLYQSKQDYQHALTQYEATIRLDPYSFRNHYNEGLMFQMLNRVQEAVASYLRALKLNPKDFNSNLNLAAAYLALNQPDDAANYAKRAVDLNDNSAAAWSNLAVALDAQQKFKEAEPAYRRALELDPTHPQIAVALAENLMHQLRYAEARSVMEQVVRAEDNPPHRKRLGDTLFLEKKYDEALGEYARALKLDARFYPALNETGWVLITEYNQSLGLEEGKRKAALDSWRHSLLINPNQPRITQLMTTYAEKFSDEGR